MYGQPQAYDQGYGQPATSAQGMYAPTPQFQGDAQGYGGTQQGYDPYMGGQMQGFAGGQPAGYDYQQAQGPQSFVGQQQGAQSFGGQPQMMDPQSFAMQQAEAQLAELEEKRLQQEEARKQKEIEHMQHRMRSGNRDQADNQHCARTLCVWGIFNGLMYGLALMGDSWSRTQWHAMGIDELNLKMGLFNLQVELQCGSDWLAGNDGGQLCHMMKRWSDHDGGSGIWSTKDFAADICDAEKSYCFKMNRLIWAGWIPLIMLPLAAGFECLSVLLSYFYWHAKPTTMVRNMADKCAAAATFSAAVAIVGYAGLRPWTNGFPRMWGTVAGNANTTDGVFTGFMEVWIWPIGYAGMCAVIGLVGSCIRSASQYGLPFHIDHPDPYGLDEFQDMKMQTLKEAQKSYGAA